MSKLFVATSAIVVLLMVSGATFRTVNANGRGGTNSHGELTQPPGCFGRLLSEFAQGHFRIRNELTGETLGPHLDSQFNPGLFGGAPSLVKNTFDDSYIERFGCMAPVPQLLFCVDFRAADDCGDPDGDGFWNLVEQSAGSVPNNALSTPEYELVDEQWLINSCGDGIDNDLDGKVDQADSGCRLTCEDFGTRDRCTDDDGDGWRNYLETFFGSDPNIAASTPESRAVSGTCSDGIDNDLDGLSDSADPDCAPF